ncbi:ribosomal RNA-processing protein 7 [Ceratobasidium sp. AG-Ba]|nr:ribosomal RNA-processing protein 7 [Ceratobasidium sp. AG-Ba]
MPKPASLTLNGFTVFPLQLQRSSVQHFLYIRQNQSGAKNASDADDRTLFLVNVPCDATARDLVSLFKYAGTVERVTFGNQSRSDPEEDEHEDEQMIGAESEEDEEEPGPETNTSKSKSKSKQKSAPPPPKPNPLIDTTLRTVERSGQTAHIIFLDPSSLSRALSLPSSPPTWPPADTSAEPRGLAMYLKRHNSCRPALDTVSTHVDAYMARFDHDQAVKRAAAASEYKKGVPIIDEDGFELVTRGGAYGKTVGGGVGVASKQFEIAAKRGELGAAKKKKKGRDKSKDLEGLYSHEQREKKRKAFMELREKFEADKMKVAKLKSTRRFKPY